MNKLIRTLTSALTACALLCGSASAAVMGDEVDGYETYLGTGMELSKGVYWTGSDYQTENYIEYTPSSSVYPVVVSGSKLCNYGNFSSMAALLEKEGKHVIGGINGDYYEMASFEPLGLVVQNGELWSSDAGHYAVGFSDNGTAVFGKPAIRTSIWLGDSVFGMDGINKKRRAGGAAIYTDRYSYRTRNSDAGTQIICSVNGALTMNCKRILTVDEILTDGSTVSIPSGKVVISVSKNASDGLLAAINAVNIGDKIPLAVSSPAEWANVRYAIGSLYKLVSNGQVESGLPGGIAPRSAIGMRADGSLVFYTNDGRQSGYSIGVSMTTLANRMIELGCVEATIMDGGGSTSMNAIYIGDSSVSQINKPSGGYQRSVSNYIMLVTEEVPTGTPSRLALYPLSTNLLSGTSMNYTVKSADVNGYATSVPDGVSLSVSEGLGTIISDGRYVALGEGAGTVTASADGLTPASVKVNVVTTPDILRVFYEGRSVQATSISVKTGTVTELMAQAMDNYVYLTSQDNCYEWSVTGNIGTIDENGTFIAGSESAQGSIVVKAGEKSVTIPVKVTKPGLFDDVNPGDWYYDASQYVGENGIMSGTSNRTFSPEVDMSRAMAVMVLHRIEGSPSAEAAKFSDVLDGDWYANAVYWASQNGIVEGYDGRFDPDGSITREQLAVIMWRYSGSPDSDYDLSSYEDISAVSPWAVTAMKWAVDSGLISGITATTLLPTVTANRAQVATILMRMLSK